MKKYNIVYKIIWITALVLFVFLVIHFLLYGMAGKHYNQGNAYFKEGDYASAESKYLSALIERYTKHMECRIRINYALSITTPITPDSVTSDNLDESIERLEFARAVLCQNGCAHENDSNGHNKKAQTLKDEIDEYIKQLKENVKTEEEKDNAEKDEKDDGNNNEKDDKLQDDTAFKKQQDVLKKSFEAIQNDGMTERMQDAYAYQYNGNYGFYSGKSW